MYALLDIGGTKMRLGIARTQDAIDEFVILPTPAIFSTAVDVLLETAKPLIGQETVTKVVCGVPGPLNADKSAILNAPNLSDWNNQPLKEKLGEIFNAPIQIENDAALAGLGEAMFGAGRENNIVVYMTISTGIGGVRISNGVIDKAAYGFEPGHQIIVPNGELCSCGALGHLEAYASGTAILKRYGQKPENIKDPNAWQETINYLSLGIYNIITIWSPDIIVLGGSVSQHINIEQLQTAVQNLKPVFHELPQIKKSVLGEKSGLFGALTLANNAS